jgi:hypothetical protein
MDSIPYVFMIVSLIVCIVIILKYKISNLKIDTKCLLKREAILKNLERELFIKDKFLTEKQKNIEAFLSDIKLAK